MNWLKLFTGSKGSSATVNISGKEVEVRCSASADRALAMRDVPLIVEIELAFACFARKQVHFHETSASKNLIEVNGKLALLISTFVPDTCEPAAKAKSTSTNRLQNFVPKWVRIDCVKGEWIGEYGL
jgi:hypothetical protein